jgi:hypothetical protein
MGLHRDVARTAVVAGTWTAVSNRMSRHQAGRWAAEGQSNQPAYMPPPPGRYQRPMFQAQQLANLKSQGLLTGEQFQTQKRAILRS